MKTEKLNDEELDIIKDYENGNTLDYFNWLRQHNGSYESIYGADVWFKKTAGLNDSKIIRWQIRAQDAYLLAKAKSNRIERVSATEPFNPFNMQR